MQVRPRRSKASKIPRYFGLLVVLAAALLCVVVLFGEDGVFREYGSSAGASGGVVGSIKKNGGDIPVFYPVYKSAAKAPSAVTEKLVQDISYSASVGDIVPLDVEHPGEFLRSCTRKGGVKGTSGVQERFFALKASKQPHLANELLKYCAMNKYQGGLYLDSQSTLSITIDHIVKDMNGDGNLAVLNDPKISPDSIHGALLYVKKRQSASVIEGMIETLLSTDVVMLEKSPLLLPKTLFKLIKKDASSSSSSWTSSAGWHFLQHSCSLISSGQRPVVTPISEFAVNSYRLTQNCPEPNGLCCNIHDPTTHTPAMVTKHLLLPYQVLPPPSELPKPLNHANRDFDDLPYIATISETVHSKPPDHTLLTPNFYESMAQNSCLPDDVLCSSCLRSKKSATCEKCAEECECYCKALCHTTVEKKFVSKSLVVTPPMYARDPSRLVPRIIHQTYFENVTQDKYPNMSRLVESFKQSGWQYKFYTDEMSLEFLSTHFPPEVREAYETIVPGAFKADLFRYCVLLIHGGVYADVDILLEANLDVAIAPDIGFMVPHDEPGHAADRVMCLWNGLIAAAPGHPFLAQVVETVVNNVRNRFTSVDYDNMFCPNVELGVLHSFDTLFTAGPCILGATVNKVIGRHGQTSFVPGDIDLSQATKKSRKKVPGRAIILRQDKNDMGSHRFTFLENNLVIASTDIPGADDRANQENSPTHYSKTHVKTGIYGVKGVYKDSERADEELRIYVDGQWSQYTNNMIAASKR